jgi:hypothetical protein
MLSKLGWNLPLPRLVRFLFDLVHVACLAANAFFTSPHGFQHRLLTQNHFRMLQKQIPHVTGDPYPPGRTGIWDVLLISTDGVCLIGEQGDKVKITLQFRGREMEFQDLGRELM